jgi:hypothetical protein
MDEQTSMNMVEKLSAFADFQSNDQKSQLATALMELFNTPITSMLASQNTNANTNANKQTNRAAQNRVR